MAEVWPLQEVSELRCVERGVADVSDVCCDRVVSDVSEVCCN